MQVRGKERFCYEAETCNQDLVNKDLLGGNGMNRYDSMEFKL